MLMYWTHTPPAPWQTDDWLQQMRQQLRASAYLRLIENRFVSGESDFIDIEWGPTVRQSCVISCSARSTPEVAFMDRM
jgi:hypothetical protein